MHLVHRIIQNLAFAPALVGIGIASPAVSVAQGPASISIIPAKPQAGSVVTVDVKFKGQCSGGRLSFGDGTADKPLSGSPSVLGTPVQHVYSSGGSYIVHTYFAIGSTPVTPADNAKFTANCKGGPVTLNVAGASNTSSGGASITISPAQPAAGSQVTINVQYKGDCAGGSLSFGDGTADRPLAQGSAGQGAVVQHTYAKGGSYSVQSSFASGPPSLGPELVAKFTANCKGGPVTLRVVAPSSASNTNGAVTTCNDGTTSNTTGKGACAHHGGIAAAASTSPNTPPAPPAPVNTNTVGTPCNDGTTSNETGKGACAHHGGMKAAAASPNAPPAPPPAPNTNTNGTTLCNDGTTSNTTGKGACAHHGGIKKDSTANAPPGGN